MNNGPHTAPDNARPARGVKDQRQAGLPRFTCCGLDSMPATAPTAPPTTMPGGPPTEIPAASYDLVTFDNRFPSFTADPPEPSVAGDALTPVAPALGRAEVVVFTGDHDATLAELPVARLRSLVDVWADRTTVLGRRPEIGYVFPFENKGEEIGVTLNHPHGQIYGYPDIPPIPAQEIAAARRYRAEHGIATPWETRERIVVALAGRREEESLIRRAVRIAERTPGSELLAVHVADGDGRPGADPAVLAGQRALVESLAGDYHQVVGDDPAAGVLAFARAEDATQIVLGGSRRTRLGGLVFGDQVVPKVTRQAGSIDVHLLAPEGAAHGPVVSLPPPTGGVGRARLWWGAVAAAALLPTVTWVLTWIPGFGLAGQLLLYLLAVVGVALVGGLYPALVAAVAAGVLADYYFVPPVHTLTIGRPVDAGVLVVFVLVALMVSGAVERAARRSRAAARASVEATTLSELATGVLRGRDDLPALLERIRSMFAFGSVALLERDTAGERRWFVAVSSGQRPPERPEEADVQVAVTDDLVLAGRGRPLDAGDRRVLRGCAAQIAAGWQGYRQRQRTAQADERLTVDQRRAQLLQAAGADLTAELATARGCLEGLRDHRQSRTPDEYDSVCQAAEAAVDRMGALVGDLVDVSRLHTGTLEVFLRPVDLDEVLAVALGDLGAGGHALTVRLPEDLPDVIADAALLTRLVTDLAAQALRRSPPEAPPRAEAVVADGLVDLSFVDHGSAVPRPDADRGAGSLVLRVSADLAQAIGAELRQDETAGGGLTTVLRLPAAGRGGTGRSVGEATRPR